VSARAVRVSILLSGHVRASRSSARGCRRPRRALFRLGGADCVVPTDKKRSDSSYHGFPSVWHTRWMGETTHHQLLLATFTGWAQPSANPAVMVVKSAATVAVGHVTKPILMVSNALSKDSVQCTSSRTIV